MYESEAKCLAFFIFAPQNRKRETRVNRAQYPLL